MANDFDQEGPEVAPAVDVGADGRRSASEGRSCEHCNRPLTGKKERFCSDACRMAWRREREATDLASLLDTIVGCVEAIRKRGGLS